MTFFQMYLKLILVNFSINIFHHNSSLDFIMSIPVGILLIQKAITVIVLIVDIRNVVVVIVVVVHVVLETVSIRVLAQVLCGKDKPKKSKKEEDGENEFGGSHVYLKLY